MARYGNGVAERCLDQLAELHRSIANSPGSQDVSVELWQALGLTVTVIGVLQEQIDALKEEQNDG